MIWRIARWPVYALLVLLALLAVAVAAVQTGPGKQVLASKLSDWLSSPESGIEIAGVEGWIPLDMSVTALRLSDADGVWLTAEGITLDWSASALLGGRIEINGIGAERIHMPRAPKGEDPSPPPPSDEPFRLPELPASLPPITLERLAVPSISLGAPVLGEALELSLDGSLRANDRGDQVKAVLDLRRVDQTTAAVALEATAGLDPQTLDLTLTAEESGGLVASLAGRPDMDDLDLALKGNGPLSDWSGRLEANAGGLAAMEADLGLALTDQPRLTIEGAAIPANGVLPDDIAALIGERLTLDLDVVQTKAQALDLRKATIATDLASLEAGGAADFDAGDVTLEAAFDLPDLGPLGPLALASLGGGIVGDLTVDGTLSKPAGRLDLRVIDPAFDDMTAALVNSSVAFEAIEPLSSEDAAFAITLDGGASDLSIPGAVLPDPGIGWRASAEVPLNGAITINRATLETAGASLTAAGRIDPVTLDGAIDLGLDAPSLNRLAGPYGQPIDGRAEITAAITLAEKAEDVAIDLAATLSDLANLPPGAAELLGGRADLKATAALTPDRKLTLEDITIRGAAIGFDGEAAADLAAETLDGAFALALPDLAVLTPLVPSGIGGAIDLEATIGGSFGAPSADMALTSRDLLLAGEPIQTLGIDLEGDNLAAAPSGRLDVDLNARGLPAQLGLAYRLADDRLNLETIELRAPETEIGGDVAIDLDTTLAEGALDGRIADLGALEPLIQQALGGSVDLGIRLIPDGTRQNAEIAVQGEAMEGAFGTLKTIDLDGSATDLTAAPGFDARATLTGFEQGTTAVDGLTLGVRGTAEAVDIQLNAAGEAIQPFELAASGNLALADGLTLILQRLQGAFAGEPLRLARPMTASQAGDRLALRDLDLQLGEASLRGNVEIGETAASGAIDLQALPLSWSELFGGPALSGEANANIDLSGSVARPTIVAALTVDGVLAEELAAEDVPLDVALNATLDQGRLAADFTSSKLTREPITAAVSLPANLALRPFAFDMPPSGDLDGRLNAELLLPRVADLLALDGQVLEGTLFADIAIGGTLGEPRIQGPVRLEGGGYENDATGTDIRDLVLTALASNERIDLEQLAGSTGKKGLLSSSGWLQLNAEEDFPLAFTLRLDQAKLVDRDDAEARISGEIGMNGTLKRAEITGDLLVNRAEISIPDGGGPNLPEIDVVEVGGNIVNPPVDENQDGTEKEPPFDPALNIDVSLPKKIYVRGRGLDSEWEGDLSISGRASEPVIVGDLSIRKGFFDFLDKRFQLELGEITFSGASPPNPLIALEAVAEDDGFTAIIKLTGPADDPQLLLESEPALPEDEVLARLLFNRELSEIGPVEAGKLALAVNRLRGGGGFDAFGEIRDILKIDTLDVVSDEEGESSVKAGKYLSDDVYVEVEKGSGEASGRARVEVELLPNIALEAETGEDANSGVGVKWKFDY